MREDTAWFSPDPASFVHARPEIHETHISVIVLVGDRAVKLKKPVALGFLDWTTRDSRAAACRREVALNRRLAPDVYLGVADVVGPDGRPVDHLVVMRRMPAARCLSRLVEDGADLGDRLDDLARRLAAFHAGAARSPAIDEAAGRDAVQKNWEDNLAVLHDATATILDGETVDALDRLAHAYLAGRAALFAERAASGLAVDGHGDLLADDIYLLDDGPRVLDCLEYDDRLRAVDVLDDVAFLAMDLERLGAGGLATGFLDAYRRHSNSAHPVSLAHHFVAYRAGVRAKVACIRARRGDEGAAREARTLVDLARRHLEAGRVRLVLVGGLPGTGKSTLARGLGARTGWPVLRSDVVRKELAGVDATTPLRAAFAEGPYAPAGVDATYAALLGRAGRLLARGETVVVDASFVDVRHRDAAGALAASCAAELVALRCDAPSAVSMKRLVRREGADASDATPQVAAAMAARADPWPDAETIDTTVDPADAQRAAAVVLGLG